jgi:hypothetical protein
MLIFWEALVVSGPYTYLTMTWSIILKVSCLCVYVHMYALTHILNTRTYKAYANQKTFLMMQIASLPYYKRHTCNKKGSEPEQEQFKQKCL